MLTDQELRQAVFALTIIEERGDPDEFDLILKEARDKTPAADDRWNMTLGVRFQVEAMADRLAGLLGESRKRCEIAAVNTIGTGRQRAVFDALVSYADELTGQTTRRTSSAAPTIRIVANREAVA